MPEDQNKPRFEPPPWEREAFDRFQQERARSRAAEELDEAIWDIRQERVAPETPEPTSATPAAAITGQDNASEDAELQAATRPVLPDARIDAMLIQLRSEEPEAPPPSMLLINSVSAVLIIAGLAIVIQSAKLFSESGSENAAVTMIAATVSFVILMVGVGMMTVATILFRKYHR